MSLELEKQEYEERLRYSLKILSKNLNEGKIKVAKHLIDDFKESMRNIKYDVNGEIILDSVDRRIRSMALSIE
ncbi:hypothetical protein OFM94_17055, partial [Acinetobacter baumannii]|nr:hypothetical protein [Acinetobacter baumannii]